MCTRAGLVLLCLFSVFTAKAVVSVSEPHVRSLCEDLLSPQDIIDHNAAPKITYYPSSRVSLKQSYPIYSGARSVAVADIRVEDYIGSKPSDHQSLLFLQITNNAHPLTLNLDSVLQNWGLVRTAKDLRPIEVRVQRTNYSKTEENVYEFELKLMAPAYTTTKKYAVMPAASGHYLLKLKYTPNRNKPDSENARMDLSNFPYSQKFTGIEDKPEYITQDPRMGRRIFGETTYTKIEASLVLAGAGGPKAKTFFEVRNAQTGEELYSEHIPLKCTDVCPIVFSKRINNLKPGQAEDSSKYFSEDMPDNTLFYVVGTQGTASKAGELLMYVVDQNPVTLEISVKRYAYTTPVGYKIRKVEQTKTDLTVYLEHLDSRFAMSMVAEFKKYNAPF